MDSGNKIVVGLNKYQASEEEEQRVPVFKVDPQIEEIAVQRVREFRAQRDQVKVKMALDRARETAHDVNVKWPRGGDLMPALIETARAGATLGEMQVILREEFGWGYVY